MSIAYFWPVTAARDEALAVFNEGPLLADSVEKVGSSRLLAY